MSLQRLISRYNRLRQIRYEEALTSNRLGQVIDLTKQIDVAATQIGQFGKTVMVIEAVIYIKGTYKEWGPGKYKITFSNVTSVEAHALIEFGLKEEVPYEILELNPLPLGELTLIPNY